MRPVTQSRTGEENGTCFRASLASILNLREDQVPDFTECNEDPGVNQFLKRYGLKYEEVPYDRENLPIGWHTVLGISPRGGMHCVVGKDGKIVWDPHPQDGTGRGLVKPTGYGLLLSVGARDALRGEELSSAARKLKTKHDEMWTLPTRSAVGAQTAYASMVGPVGELLREAEALLRSTRISDKAVWLGKLDLGKKFVVQAKADAAKGDYESAAYRVDAALSSAHHIIDALRGLARRTGAKDTLSNRQLDKYSMQSLLDTLGIDIKAFIDRPPQQRDVMLETAFNELERLGKSSKKGGSVVARAKDMRSSVKQWWDSNGKNAKCPECGSDDVTTQAYGGQRVWKCGACGKKQLYQAYAKDTDSGIITNPTGYRPCVGDKVGALTIESIGSDTATLSNGTRIALKFLVSTRRTGEWKIGNTRGYDATDSRRSRLHKALDRVLDSRGGRARDASEARETADEWKKELMAQFRAAQKNANKYGAFKTADQFKINHAVGEYSAAYLRVPVEERSGLSNPIHVRREFYRK